MFTSIVHSSINISRLFWDYCNTVRLHSAIAYITPSDKLAGRAEAIWAARRQKLATANAKRRAKTKEKEIAPA